MFKCSCGSSQFVLTETASTITSIFLDADISKDISCYAKVKHVQASFTYSLTCTKCGKTWTYTQVKPQSISGSIFFDYESVLKDIKEKGIEIPTSTNIDEE